MAANNKKNDLFTDINQIIIDEATNIKNQLKDTTSKENQKKIVDTAKTSIIKETDEELRKIDVATEVKKSMDSVAVSTMINDMINKQIDDVVELQVKKARKAFNDSDINSALSTAQAYYKKIFDSEKLLSDMKTDYTKSLSKSINSSINDRLNKIQNSLGGKWGRKLLADSQISSSVTKFVSHEVASVIDAIVSNKAIAQVSKDIIDTVTRLKKAATEQLKTTFKSQIEYASKLKKAVQDKIDVFNKKRQEYIQKAQAYVNKLQQAVADQVKKWQDAAVNEISKYIKLNMGSISL